MPESLRHDDFEPHVGKLFRFPGSSVALRLVGVEVSARAPAPGEARPAFTLIFHGPVGTLLPEGYYPAQVEDGPVLDFYIIPIHTARTDRQEYQAVFN